MSVSNIFTLGVRLGFKEKYKFKVYQTLLKVNKSHVTRLNSVRKIRLDRPHM